MRHAPEPLLPLRTRLLHDVGTVAILGLILVPFYLLLNQYWKSLILLTASYGVLGLAFLRLGRYMRRVMRRTPAEIPPWYMPFARASRLSRSDLRFAAAEAIEQASKDPHYLEEVLKPKLRQLLAYRLQGSPHMPLEALDVTHLSPLEPAVLDFLQRRDRTGLWTRCWHRQQRLQDVLTVLRYLEAL